MYKQAIKYLGIVCVYRPGWGEDLLVVFLVLGVQQMS